MNGSYRNHFAKVRQVHNNPPPGPSKKKPGNRLRSKENRMDPIMKGRRRFHYSKSVPLPIVTFLICGILITGLVIGYFDKIHSWMDLVTILPFSSSIAKEATPKPSAEKSKQSAKISSKDSNLPKKTSPGDHKNSAKSGEVESDPKAKEEKEANADPQTSGEQLGDIRNWSAEEVQFFSRLGERKRELDLREAELKKMEVELEEQKGQMEKKFQQLEQMRREIASLLENRVTVDKEKIEKLVEFYSNMKPENAAKIFETLDIDLAVAILGKMKKKDAANILNLVQPAKGRLLSEKYTGYR